jgi:GT2 family glycosyltransferase
LTEADKYDTNLPSVSVCIVTYNSGIDIGECLDRVNQQTWPNVSVVIVDNASVDDTLSLITAKYSYVKIIMNTENKGFAAGQNQAINAVYSDYVLVLNPDVALDPDYIKELVIRMEANPEIGITGGCLTLASHPDLIDTAGLEMKWTRKAVERGAGQPYSNFLEPCKVFGVSGAAAMYSRRMINKISIEGQFFDERFFAYKEDVDVAWRARLLGWKAWYEPTAKARHIRHWGRSSQRNTIPLDIRKHSYKNRYLMLVKNETLSMRFWWHLPGLIGFELMMHGYLLLTDPRILGCWIDLIGLLPETWRKRKIIQRKKTSYI